MYLSRVNGPCGFDRYSWGIVNNFGYMYIEEHADFLPDGGWAMLVESECREYGSSEGFERAATAGVVWLVSRTAHYVLLFRSYLGS